MLVAACAEPGFDLAALETRHPELRELASQRLADTQPYTLALAGRATLFLCRWPDGEPIPVSLPGDATPEQRTAMLAAVSAWQAAGIGVRFGPPSARREGIEIRLRDDIVRTQANTISDCQVDLGGSAPELDGDPLPARLVFASIHLARRDPQLTGTLLHELGHALGYQGHTTRGKTVMLTSASRVAEQGRRVRAGAAFDDVALRALYVLPSGTVLARHALDPGRTEVLDRLAQLAQRKGFAGPQVRVGDDSGLVYWRDREGRRVGVSILGVRRVGARPSSLRLEPDRRARELLEAAELWAD